MITRENEKWFRIAGLLARQRVGQLSEEELRELEEWREVSPENKLLYDRWQDGNISREPVLKVTKELVVGRHCWIWRSECSSNVRKR